MEVPIVPHFSTLPPALKTAINLAFYNKKLLPSKDLIFHAFYTHPLKTTKVIILGPEPASPSGLAFGHTSLRNIFKELHESIPETASQPPDYSLESWTNQGVLLLNTKLTSIKGRVNAHGNLGWESIVSEFIKELDKVCYNKVYLLWGKDAQSFSRYIDSENNLILKAAHPSPFSASKGFFGCDHFAESNDYLERKGRGKIIW